MSDKVKEKREDNRLKKMHDACKADHDLKGITGKKKWVLFCLKMSRGIVQIACQNAGLSRQQFYQWCKESSDVYDKKFAEKVEEIKNITHDFVESKLLENIDNNDQRAIEYYLANNARDRGYSSSTITQKTDVTSGGEKIEALSPFMQVIMQASKKQDGDESGQ